MNSHIIILACGHWRYSERPPEGADSWWCQLGDDWQDIIWSVPIIDLVEEVERVGT